MDRGLEVLGTTDDLAEVLEDVEPDEVLIAIPSAPATLRARVVIACRERGVPVRTMPTVFELLQGGGRLDAPAARGAGRGRARAASPCGWRSSRVGGYLTGRLRAGHRRGRLDRLRALPPDRARRARAGSCCSTTAEANLFEIERELVDERHVLTRGLGARRLQGRGAHARGVRRARARGRVPRRRLQARGADGGQPDRGGAQQRARHARADARSRARPARARSCSISTDKAVAPATVMGASKALAEWAVEAADAPLPGHGVLRRALRQRARLLGLGGADLPAPDRRRRPGHGDRPAR